MLGDMPAYMLRYAQAVKKRPSKKIVGEALEAGAGKDISQVETNTPEAIWPPECIEKVAELRFKHPTAKLYPLLNQVVETPK